ncbi:MAG: divalent-cation tolerance protein CutA [Verrucomicrobiales bacterium]
MSLVVAVTTFPEKAYAEMAAKTLVQERLAACVHVFPLGHSVYTWNGQIEQGDECQCFIKTTEERLADLQERVTEMNPYDNPEFFWFKPDGASKDYADWVEASTR